MDETKNTPVDLAEAARLIRSGKVRSLADLAAEIARREPPDDDDDEMPSTDQHCGTFDGVPMYSDGNPLANAIAEHLSADQPAVVETKGV